MQSASKVSLGLGIHLLWEKASDCAPVAFIITTSSLSAKQLALLDSAVSLYCFGSITLLWPYFVHSSQRRGHFFAGGMRTADVDPP